MTIDAHITKLNDEIQNFKFEDVGQIKRDLTKHLKKLSYISRYSLHNEELFIYLSQHSLQFLKEEVTKAQNIITIDKKYIDKEVISIKKGVQNAVDLFFKGCDGFDINIITKEIF